MFVTIHRSTCFFRVSVACSGFLDIMAMIPVAAAHGELGAGAVVGDGGVALKLFVALEPKQAQILDKHGQLEAPLGRGRWCYWPLKLDPVVAAGSAASAHPGLQVNEVVLRPVSITYVGLLKMVEGGELSCCDAGQWRLHACLQNPGKRDDAGNLLYQIHEAFLFSK